MDRYTLDRCCDDCSMSRDPEGGWVEWEDHQTIVAQHEARNATTTMKSIEIGDDLRARVAELEETVKDMQSDYDDLLQRAKDIYH